MSVSLRQNDTETEVADIFSYMCSLAVQKCSKKAEKKKASSGGNSMRKRLLIKNFVTQMLDQERQMSNAGREQLSREVGRNFHHSTTPKSMQTQINNNNNEEEMDEEEEEEIDESVDEEYQPSMYNNSLQMTNNSLTDKDCDESDEEDELNDTSDSLNNNSKHSLIDPTAMNHNSQLPGISTLDLEVHHRPFAPNPYLSSDSTLAICDDDSADLNDELAPGAFELFPNKSTLITSTALTSPHSKHATAPPSWIEGTETDLFMLERSTPTSLVVDSYGMSYRHDDFSTHSMASSNHFDQHHSYQMSANSSSDSSFMISSSVVSNPSLATLPKSFLDETFVSAADSTAPFTSMATTYAELHTTNNVAAMPTPPTNSYFPSDSIKTHCEFGESNVAEDGTDLDSATIGLCVEDNAQVVVDENEVAENDDTSSDDDAEDEQQSIVSSAFVDLINMAPVKLRIGGNCRTEALHDATCYAAAQRQITDLDNQLTLIEENDEDEFAVDTQLQSRHLMMSDTKLSAAMLDYDSLTSPSLSELIGSDVYAQPVAREHGALPVSGNSHLLASPNGTSAGRSPSRKRLSPLDYGLMLSAAMSPKRIKL